MTYILDACALIALLNRDKDIKHAEEAEPLSVLWI